MTDIDPIAETPQRTSRRFRLVSAGLAFLMWGTWAYWINLDFSGERTWASPLTSAITQGTGSFVITLLMVRSVTWLYHRMTSGWAKRVMPALITVAVTSSCLAIAHTLVGTSNVIGTIAPAICVAFVFNIYTSFEIGRVKTAVEDGH